jgi:hypothetical protein
MLVGRAPRVTGRRVDTSRASGSLTRRMIGVAALWIVVLLSAAGSCSIGCSVRR